MLASRWAAAARSWTRGGVVVAEAGVDQEVLSVDIDLDSVAQIREKFPVLADRRL